MDYLRDRRAWTACIALALAVRCPDLKAQTTATATTSTSTAASSGLGMGFGTGMGMGTGMGGMGLMPMISAMNPTASLSATDAAALGMPGPGNGGANMMNGVFMNPMAAPYMLGYPMSPTQIGGMMMMNQMGGSGIGSGQLSGVRPGMGQAKGRTKQVSAKPAGTTGTPGGLASRYFGRTASTNRPTNVSRVPQNYYARQNRYYPKVAR
jgi:hypothetical protein